MIMKPETITSAALNAAAFFIGGIVALFTENPELTLQTIKQATWITIGGGALLAFIKAYQEVDTRRLLARMRGKNVEVSAKIVNEATEEGINDA